MLLLTQILQIFIPQTPYGASFLHPTGDPIPLRGCCHGSCRFLQQPEASLCKKKLQSATALTE